ncbi:MAG: ribosome biogenesis GTPase Der [Pseudomonadota bacterium]
MSFTLTIVGRPNVGKSTLFNRLVGRRVALTNDRAGLTRDWREGEGRLGDLDFKLIDTAGLDEAAPAILEARMRAQTARAVAGADLVLFLIDARAGLTPLDRHFARWLRKLARPVVLIANKCEGEAEAGLGEAHGLGFGAPVSISAEHGEGLAELHRALKERAPEAIVAPEETADRPAPEPRIKLAIVGRPNVGKSTLLNRLLGEERVLTAPQPGTTRDAIAVPWRWRGLDLELIDTAGLRRKAKVETPLERLSSADSLRAVRRAQIVVLVLDARAMLEKQDLTIARHVLDEGRALVLAANKWDLVEERAAALKKLRDRLEISLPQVKNVPFVAISALTGDRLDLLMRAVFKAYEAWNAWVPTPKLNRWLEGACEAHPPPLARGRRPRPRFIKQVTSRPPTFAIFGAKLKSLPEDYSRYLANGLAETFDLSGVVVRLILRQQENPFAAA